VKNYILEPQKVLSRGGQAFSNIWKDKIFVSSSHKNVIKSLAVKVMKFYYKDLGNYSTKA